MNIKAVIWDFGGVLVRTDANNRRDALAQHVGLSREALEARVFDADNRRQAQIGAVDGEVYLQEVAAELGLSVGELRQTFFGDDHLDQTLMAYIRALRPQYRVGLLSNAMNNLREVLQTQYPILDAFDTLIISGEVGVMKPHPAIYLLAAERLGVQPGEAVFVDDFEQNIAGARQVGMHTVHFQSREQTLQALGDLLAAEHQTQ
ncbi:MAG: HAD family phosphatase [Anaerolineales bacterium]|nr:HAD family phosphatase [Anaerolineales bacterium]